MPSSQPIHAQQTCLLPLLTHHAACCNSRTVAVRLSHLVLILIWTLTYIHSCAMTDPADYTLTSKPAHTSFPYYCHCVHAESAVTIAPSHVLTPHPAQNVPIFPCLGSSCPPTCMTCMSLAWPVRQHACSHCAKLQSRRASGFSAIAHSKS